MDKKYIVLLLLIIITSMLITGCMPGNGEYTNSDPAGFLSGIWHGWIAPFSLIISIFNPQIRIYEPANTGWWYDFGFYIAIISGFGGLSLTRKKSKDK
ncbi:hypothetical protein [Tepidimicrobium xylanilyticum]|uniref:hypothetical protein n=1 Tax=Tepidimicrobium xylanilyticum TaxID=1123352 RepID=UPI002657155F|nr:hypothetical protein [Tepidimicrobium xylanilyticum]GMG97049.1 hypothetical protein EN5CB1_18750 [Tepidimicrobium xylanilyticum]